MATENTPVVPDDARQPAGPTIRSSASIAQLAASLARAQANYGRVLKEHEAKIESSKANFRYKYAGLDAYIAAVSPALTKEELSFIQPIVYSDGRPWLVTRLMHSSGEWIEGVQALTDHDMPREAGSELTYKLRSGLRSLLGIAAEDEDDDAQDAETVAMRQVVQASTKNRPTCTKCGSNEKVIVSKFGPGFYCLLCKEKVGQDPTVQGDPEDQAPECPACSSGNVVPVEPGLLRCQACEQEWQVEVPKAAAAPPPAPARRPAVATAGPSRRETPPCPKCGSATGVQESQYGGFYCRSCKKGFK